MGRSSFEPSGRCPCSWVGEMKKRLPGRRDRGQALVEVALVAPLFFLMFFGIIDLARVIWANDVVANAAREGARFASVSVNSIPNLPDGESIPATPADIRAKARDFVIAAGFGTTVTVCFSE